MKTPLNPPPSPSQRAQLPPCHLPKTPRHAVAPRRFADALPAEEVFGRGFRSGALALAGAWVHCDSAREKKDGETLSESAGA